MKSSLDRNMLNFWIDKDKKVEAAHLLDLCARALKGPDPVVTPFLGLGMKNWLENILQGADLHHLGWGGFDHAERVRFALDANETELCCDRTDVALIEAAPLKKGCVLGHRDVLGSLLGLGLEREVIGDIRQTAGGAVVAVTKPIEEYILQHWLSVGRESIRAARFDPDSVVLPAGGLEKRIVSASARLDGVAAAAFGISRSAMQDYIRQGRVKKNDLVITKPDGEVEAGDILSCRGEGRVKILQEDVKTRKGRSAWRIFIYQDRK